MASAAPPPVTPPADGQPVHIWLGTTGALNRGMAVRIYVQTAIDGNLVVMHRRTDGRIDVLYPAAPTQDPRVSAGTYEIRGRDDRPGLVIAEPDGTGMILAAVSADPIWFDEFARRAEWNPDALVPSWRDADPESALDDIVQRMLGDGTFNYDVLTYLVAPTVVAQEPQSAPTSPAPTQSPDSVTLEPQPVPNAAIGTCVECTVIGSQLVIIEPPIFFGRGRREGRARREPPECHAGEQCDRPIESATTSPMLAALHPSVVPSRSELAARRRFGSGASASPPPPHTSAPVPQRALAGAAPAARSALAMRYVRVHPAAGDAGPSLVPAALETAGRGAMSAAPARATSMAGESSAPSTVAYLGMRVGSVRRGAGGGTVMVPSRGAAAGASVAGARPTSSSGAVSGGQTIALPLAAWRAGGGGMAAGGAGRTGPRPR